MRVWTQRLGFDELAVQQFLHTYRKIYYTMNDQSNFYKGAVIVTVTFGAGFFFGYKFHEWRMDWLKRRRERLAQKLRDTQDQIDLLARK